jgi:hypothetical protein
MKLTEGQRRRLTEIRDYRPTAQFQHAGFWSKGATDKSLLRNGFVETITHETRLGGAGPMGGLSATFILCRITPAGRAALGAEEKANSSGSEG